MSLVDACRGLRVTNTSLWSLPRPDRRDRILHGRSESPGPRDLVPYIVGSRNARVSRVCSRGSVRSTMSMATCPARAPRIPASGYILQNCGDRADDTSLTGLDAETAFGIDVEMVKRGSPIHVTFRDPRTRDGQSAYGYIAGLLGRAGGDRCPRSEVPDIPQERTPEAHATPRRILYAAARTGSWQVLASSG